MVGEARAIRLLEVDPELGSGLSPGRFRRAREALLAPAHRLERGEWRPGRGPAARGRLGFLVLRGLLVREVRVGRRGSLELLSRGDLLRPGQEDAASFVEARWRVLEPALLAELSGGLVAELGRFPPLLDALLGRLAQRCRTLSFGAAIGTAGKLEERLLALFWQLAERHGRRGAEGVVVPLPLTHEVLAGLVGARRPSVTQALGRLAAERSLLRHEDGWLLPGELPPALSA